MAKLCLVRLFEVPWTAAHQASLSFTVSQLCRVYLFSHVQVFVCSPTGSSPPGSSVHGILRAKILEWVAISFSRGSSQLRDQTQVSYIAGGFCTMWTTREALLPRVCSDSCPLSLWCYLTISFSVTPFSSCSQSFPASGSFPMSWLFASGGQSIGASASASILPMYI